MSVISTASKGHRVTLGGDADLADLLKFGSLAPLQYRIHHFHLEALDILILHERDPRLVRYLRYASSCLLEGTQGRSEIIFQSDLLIGLYLSSAFMLMRED